MPPVGPRKRKSRKTAYKGEPYREQALPQNGPNKVSELHFNPALKTSAYSSRSSIEKGGNPVFTFPIPPADTRKASMLNDEVDMYFPRKHFFTKFQVYNELLDNALMKPIPAHRIIPPRLFPIPFVGGIPYEKQKAVLLQQAGTETGPQGEPDAPPSKQQTETKETSEESVAGPCISDVATVDREKEHFPTQKDAATKEGGDEASAKGPGDEIAKAGEEDGSALSKAGEGNAKVAAHDDDYDDLSDYDPYFDHRQLEPPKETEQQVKYLEKYLCERIASKNPTDFMFGDLKTMQLQERALAEEKLLIEKELEEPIKISERYEYNMKSMESLHAMYRTYTAKSIFESQEALDKIETEIETKFKMKLSTSEGIRQFSTDKFDSVKVAVTLEEYNDKYKQLVNSAAIQTKALGGDEQFLDKSLYQPTQLEPIQLDVGHKESFPEKLGTQQEQPQLGMDDAIVPTGVIAVSDNIPNQPGNNGLITGNEKDLHNMDDKSNDAFYKGQSFDFDSNMLYDGDDFDGNNNDEDDFASLNNEVFLNM